MKKLCGCHLALKDTVDTAAGVLIVRASYAGYPRYPIFEQGLEDEINTSVRVNLRVASAWLLTEREADLTKGRKVY
jgi:hypothetical protein